MQDPKPLSMDHVSDSTNMEKLLLTIEELKEENRRLWDITESQADKNRLSVYDQTVMGEEEEGKKKKPPEKRKSEDPISTQEKHTTKKKKKEESTPTPPKTTTAKPTDIQQKTGLKGGKFS